MLLGGSSNGEQYKLVPNRHYQAKLQALSAGEGFCYARTSPRDERRPTGGLVVSARQIGSCRHPALQ